MAYFGCKYNFEVIFEPRAKFRRMVNVGGFDGTFS